MAIDTIAEIHSRNKIPVVCGGTNYYIEAIMLEKTPSEDIDFNEFKKRMDMLWAQADPKLSFVLDLLEINVPLDNKQLIED